MPSSPHGVSGYFAESVAMGLDYSTESDGARRRLISGMKIQYPVVPVVLADVQVLVELRKDCAAADGTPTSHYTFGSLLCAQHSASFVFRTKHHQKKLSRWGAKNVSVL